MCCNYESFLFFWLFNISFEIFVDRCQCINKTNSFSPYWKTKIDIKSMKMCALVILIWFLSDYVSTYKIHTEIFFCSFFMLPLIYLQFKYMHMLRIIIFLYGYHLDLSLCVYSCVYVCVCACCVCVFLCALHFLC